MFRATALNLLRHNLATEAFPTARISSCSRSGLARYLNHSHVTITQARAFSASHVVRQRIRYTRFGETPSGPSGPPGGKWTRNGVGARVVTGVGVLTVVYYIAHLEQVPETGRWRFMNTSPGFEERFGRMAREQTLQEYRERTLPYNHPISRHVRRVVSRILAASNLGHIRGEPPEAHFNAPATYHAEAGEEAPWDPDTRFQSPSGNVGPYGHQKEWDVIVVNDPKMINAQALPGLIIVYTGILPVCKDEQGLSAVLSHEVGHVVARHTAERISSQTITISLLVVAQILGLDFGLSSILQRLLFELPNSRTQELEADKIGLTLMSRACFDPRGAVDMFERLGRIEAKRIGANLEFMSTHPTSAARVERLEKLLPDAYSVMAANPECAAAQDRLQHFREVALGGGGTAESWNAELQIFMLQFAAGLACLAQWQGSTQRLKAASSRYWAAEEPGKPRPYSGAGVPRYMRAIWMHRFIYLIPEPDHHPRSIAKKAEDVGASRGGYWGVGPSLSTSSATMGGLESGTYYIIRSAATKQPIGRRQHEDRSLLPKVIVNYPEDAKVTEDLAWKVTELGPGRYKLENRRGAAIELDGHVYAAIAGHVFGRWEITFHEQAKGYTITDTSRGNGWVLVDEDKDNQIACRPLIVGPSYPPYYPPQEIWKFEKFNEDD
ncbi:putative peptidase family M48 [Lyophyllum shimeji]|uniref:Peptidase family M48 n=1 Tax=Lyophyllum shimeji TaxID=47721 RepID=A0A9P3PW13_LYOSH|nr:putative peptidase family M48 [Lyophyllum shimeji]